MAILLAKLPCRQEVVNDLNGDLINLTRVLQDRREGPALYRRLRRVLFAQDEFDAALRAVGSAPPPAADGLDPDRALIYFVASWQGTNGIAGTTARPKLAKRYSSSGGDPATRWHGAVSSIPAWRRRLARVTVLRECGIAMLGRIEDREGTAIVVDPPYLSKGAKYVHDFATADHAALAAALSRFRATRVVLSYYDDPRLDALYPGWHKLALRANKAMANANGAGGGAVAAPEILLSNRPFPAGSEPACTS